MRTTDKGATTGGTTNGAAGGAAEPGELTDGRAPAAGGLRERRAELEREWARWAPGPAGRAALRSEVAESWARSGASVDRSCAEAPVGDADAARSRWAHSRLRGPVNAVAEELRRIADDAGFVAAVTDESGMILWTCGGPAMRRQAERVNFAPGGRWDEQAMGTNALSLALLRGQASTVFSAEHYLSALHGWVCYCAPIRDRAGRVLGVLDLSTSWDRSHPLALSTVRLLAAGIEERLREGRDDGAFAPIGRTEAPSGSGSPASAGPADELRLTVLGDAPGLHRDGRELPLRPRQLEILTLLALEPEGFTPERLHDALYGDRSVSGSTFKAEVSHLRTALGGGIATRRYALTRPLRCDAAEVHAALQRGDTAAAAAAYSGPLLPRSEAPGVVEWREHLEVALREAALAAVDPTPALALGRHARYDIALHRHALDRLDPHDARRGIAAARLRAAMS
ncbi:GAF domain-containing protein [Streptacidiphilus rugosus]|uniref:GAF domain-containing protein n=1 Tax=Streptacidiphilus rugosus TaxID=405783 RepID=UPI000B02F3AB|nr:GAF domain-containing protein [Streptacidiphilus rugosus]